MIHIISRKVIKPSCSSPLKSYKLSSMDQLTTDSYIPFVSFYPNTSFQTTTETAHILEKSLSKLLKSYYPFAGTLTDNVSINCNDKGVTLLETQINAPMSEILQEPVLSLQDIIFPSDLPWAPVDKDNLVIVQLNHFKYGGKALGVCMTHKIGDAFTLTNFLRDWAAIARQSGGKPSPEFIGTSIFPPKGNIVKPFYDITKHDQCAGRRFSFDGKTIARLKELVSAESGIQNPTRVEVITAFLYKSAVAATMANSNSQFKPSVLFQVANSRRLAVPPLPEHSVGNVSFLFPTPIIEEEDMQLSRLVSKLRRSKVEFFEKCKRMNLNDILSESIQNLEKQKDVSEQNEGYYICTSVCGFQLNNLDFGWGKPLKVALGAVPETNRFVLIDDKNGDGIEATVTLNEKVMSIFQSDKELRALTSPYMYV